MSQTVFAPYNLISTILVIIVMAVIIYFSQPKQDLKIVDKSLLEAQDKEDKEVIQVKENEQKTFASLLENAWILNVIIFLIGLIYLSSMGLN